MVDAAILHGHSLMAWGLLATDAALQAALITPVQSTSDDDRLSWLSKGHSPASKRQRECEACISTAYGLSIHIYQSLGIPLFHCRLQTSAAVNELG